MDTSAAAFRSRADKPPMRRRPASPRVRVARVCLLGLGWFPPGRKSPESALPPVNPDRAVTETRLRAAVSAWMDLDRTLLPARAHDLFVKHAVLGDLTLREWMRFHEVHAAHHLKQIRARVQSPR